MHKNPRYFFSDKNTFCRKFPQYLIALLFFLVCAACAKSQLTELNPTSFFPTPATLSPAQRDATEGAIVQATRRVQATLDAQAIRESQSATATADWYLRQQATETALLVEKAQELAFAQASWTIVLTDTFTSNTLGWPIGIHEDDYLATTTRISDGKYIWTIVDPKHSNSYWNLMPLLGRNFTNFYAKTKLEFIQGEATGDYAFGLVFCHHNDDYGFFGLRSDGRFQVLAVFDTSIYQDIVMHSTAITLKQPNQLGVRASGSDYIFLINGRPVWYMNEDFTPGEIGLGVEVMNKGDKVQAAFTDFIVYAPK
jgi:hypothetical protein